MYGSQCWLGDGIWSISCINVLTHIFLIFSFFWRKSFVRKKFSQQNFCKNVSLGHSACLNVTHIFQIREQFRQCVQQWVLMHFLTASEFLSLIYCQKLSKNKFSLLSSTLPKTFFIRLLKHKSELGFVTPTGFPGKAVEIVLAQAWS